MMKLLQEAIVRFYCMDMMDIVWLGLVVSCVYLVIHHTLRSRYWWDLLVLFGLICFLAVMLHLTLLDRSGGHTEPPNLIPFHTYRAMMNGGHRDTYRSNFMNAALFYPAGLLATSLLPRKWPGWCRCLLVVLVLGAMSVGIEYIQYRYALGLVEIDDVIHNTAGALAGSLAVLVLTPVIERMLAKVSARLKNE